MIVLGLDPGFAKLGWCVLAQGEPIAGGVFVTKGIGKEARKAAGLSAGAEKMQRADLIGAFLSSTVSIFRPGLVAHEGISLGFHQPTTLLEMGLAFGAIASLCAHEGIKRVEVPPSRIKSWARGVLGMKGEKIEKEQVIAAALRRFPTAGVDLWGRLAEHYADSIAAARVAWRHEIGEGDPLAPLSSSSADAQASAKRYPAKSLPGTVFDGLPPLPKRKRGELPPAYTPAQLHSAVYEMVRARRTAP